MNKSLLTHEPMVYKYGHGFDYPQFFDYYESAVASVWRHQEVALEGDVRDWQNSLTDSERQLIAGVLRGFTSAELGIGCYWGDKVTSMFPKPEIIAMARMFSAFEQIHAAAYNYLSDTLGLNEFEEFISDPIARQKVERFFEYCDSDKVSLAVFSGAGEGVSLYSSFAILLAFSKLGYLKGVAQIISWSVLDEACVDGDTEYLSPGGWRSMSEYDGGSVAQFDPTTQQINFVKPTSYITKQSSEMYRINLAKRFSQYVTPNHTVVDYVKGKVRKTLAEDWSSRSSHMPVSGELVGAREMTALDRFVIALQADGHIRKGNSKREVKFYFKRERKINRFRELVEELKSDYGFSFNEYSYDNEKGGVNFSVIIPDEHLNLRTKFFDEVYTYDNIPQGFIEELVHWDGSKHPQSQTSVYYSSNQLRNVEFVQTVGSLSGYLGDITTQDDYRWKKPCRQYRIYLKARKTTSARYAEKTLVKLDNPINVYCFKVPTQAFLIRKNGLVSVTGNCHSNGGSELFKELVKETGITDLETQQILEGFEAIIQNEFQFLDNVYSTLDPSVIPISLPNLKAYIKSRANNRLANLGLDLTIPMTDQEVLMAKEISDWFDPMVKGQGNHDFFARSKSGGGYVAKPDQDFMSVDLSALDLVVK